MFHGQFGCRWRLRIIEWCLSDDESLVVEVCLQNSSLREYLIKISFPFALLVLGREWKALQAPPNGYFQRE